jgi:hypothetical protein
LILILFFFLHTLFRGRVVKVVDFKTFAPYSCGSKSRQGLWILFMWGSYPASLRSIYGSTQVPVLAWNDTEKGTWGLSPPVKQERRHMTYTLSVWRKTQSNIHYLHITFFLLPLLYKFQGILKMNMYMNIYFFSYQQGKL